MKWEKLINWEHGFHINLGQTTYSICHFLSSKPNRHRFLQQIITGDEKWVLYVKRQWINPEDLPEPEPKNDLHPKKVMLSVWWDFEGIIYYELLLLNTTIDSKLYCEQLRLHYK